MIIPTVTVNDKSGKTFSFLMNDMIWSVITRPQEVLQEVAGDDSGEHTYYGITEYSSHTIYLWELLCVDQLERTLMHELMHVYIWSYISTQTLEFNEESLCDISANSHDIIHDIVTSYAEEN